MTRMSIETGDPDLVADELFASIEQRCRYCRNKLLPLIDTELGVVWACTSVEDHGWPLVFWGGEDGEEGMRNADWIIRSLIRKAEAGGAT